jgi:hypothetical protein
LGVTNGWKGGQGKLDEAPFKSVTLVNRVLFRRPRA